MTPRTCILAASDLNDQSRMQDDGQASPVLDIGRPRQFVNSGTPKAHPEDLSTTTDDMAALVSFGQRRLWTCAWIHIGFLACDAKQFPLHGHLGHPHCIFEYTTPELKKKPTKGPAVRMPTAHFFVTDASAWPTPRHDQSSFTRRLISGVFWCGIFAYYRSAPLFGV